MLPSLNTDTPMQEDSYHVAFQDGRYFIDRADRNRSTWPLHVAKIIARNVAMKRGVVTHLVRIQEVLDADSDFDRIVNYVDTLKGSALTAELKAQGLPTGSDPVASKRVRLISHFVKVGHRA